MALNRLMGIPGLKIVGLKTEISAADGLWLSPRGYADHDIAHGLIASVKIEGSKYSDPSEFISPKEHFERSRQLIAMIDDLRSSGQVKLFNAVELLLFDIVHESAYPFREADLFEQLWGSGIYDRISNLGFRYDLGEFGSSLRPTLIEDLYEAASWLKKATRKVNARISEQFYKKRSWSTAPSWDSSRLEE